jgi:hypothetical protein
MVRQDSKRSCWTSPKGHHNRPSLMAVVANQAVAFDKSMLTACPRLGDVLRPGLIQDHAPFGRDHREGLQPCSWPGVPFRSDVRRTPPRKATQIPGRSSPAGRSPVGRRPPACHNDPPGATRPSPKDAPSDAPADLAFSASVPCLYRKCYPPRIPLKSWRHGKAEHRAHQPGV